MLTSLLATSDLAREVAALRHSDALKLIHAPCRAALFSSRPAGRSDQCPGASWHQPLGLRPSPLSQNRTQNGCKFHFLQGRPYQAGRPSQPIPQPVDLESAVDQADNGLL